MLLTGKTLQYFDVVVLCVTHPDAGRVITIKPSPFSKIPLSRVSKDRRHFTGKETHTHTHSEIKKLGQSQRQGWAQTGVPPENTNHKGTVLV